jgi:drug/metabolite transporter (DMT)-like permease
MNTPISSMAWVVLGSLIGSLGAVGLKAGTQHLEMNLRSLFSNWRLGAGVAAYVLSSVFFVFGLRQGELSVLYPLVSLSYVWTVFWSKTFFGESITRAKIISLLLILIGVGLLGLGKH